MTMVGSVVSTAARAVLFSGLLSPPAPVALLRLVRELYRGGMNLYTLLAVAAARWPDRTAIIDDDGALSYRELQSMTESIAHELSDSGAGPARRWA
ncbi:long-chain-fatty-acid-CoA ligase domain protein [Mycobacterium kansasii]|uniref:Long-chain-fatty-acid-CoA ligase domain protein n=1 Tax=Mycobacterium kansasii TaxID=1768 RepID=A0A1V3WVX4_MYCKA|nr:long-chain-fatty-acid-CoA ligase domain protein [Mycobacterium kansasii]